MDIIVISVVAFLTAILTFFSGFGLGTILAPVFALFFPIDIAIALTGVVHFTNNIFKIILVGKNLDKSVLFKFGFPAILAAFFGAWVLVQINELPSLYHYSINHSEFFITPIKLIIAIILMIFALIEVIPFFNRLEFGKDKLIIGGLLSGFFGGLSGIQGAIRSAFLIKLGLSKEAYIATGVAIACLIDFTRLSVYAKGFLETDLVDNSLVVIFAIFSAILGSLIGRNLLKKVTIRSVQLFVAIMLIIISLALAFGLV